MPNSSRSPTPLASKPSSAPLFGEGESIAGKGSSDRRQQQQSAGPLSHRSEKTRYQRKYLTKRKLMEEDMKLQLQNLTVEIEKERSLGACLMANHMALKRSNDYTNTLLEIAKHCGRESQKSSIVVQHDHYSVEKSVTEMIKYYSMDLQLSHGVSHIQVPETVEAFLQKFTIEAYQVAALLELLDCKGGNDSFIEAKVIEKFEKGIVPLYAAALLQNPKMVWEFLASTKVPYNYDDKVFKNVIMDKIKLSEEQIKVIKEIYAKFEMEVAQISGESNAMFKSVNIQDAVGFSINRAPHDDDINAADGHTLAHVMHDVLLQAQMAASQMETMHGYLALFELSEKLEMVQQRLFAAVLKLSDSFEFTLTPIQRCRYIALDPSSIVDYVKICQVLSNDSI